jgi:hypothetical protein
MRERSILLVISHIICALAIASGCGSGTRHAMRPASELKQMPPGHARVIFSRAVKTGWGEAYVVVDARGGLLGEVPAQSYIDVIVPAGRVTFYGWNHKVMGDYGRATMIEGTVEAGSQYFVLVVLTKDGFDLLAPNFSGMDTRQLAMVIAEHPVELVPGQPSKLDRGRVADQLAEARERLTKQSAGERALMRTLGPQSTWAAFCMKMDELGELDKPNAAPGCRKVPTSPL